MAFVKTLFLPALRMIVAPPIFFSLVAGFLVLIERPLDTFRSAVNVEDDLNGAIVVQRRLRAKTQ